MKYISGKMNEFTSFLYLGGNEQKSSVLYKFKWLEIGGHWKLSAVTILDFSGERNSQRGFWSQLLLRLTFLLCGCCTVLEHMPRNLVFLLI